MLAAVLAFAGVAAVINVTPGLDIMLVLRTSVSGGWRAGLAAAVGVNTGCLAWGLATAAGLSALLTASHVAFDVVRIAGGVYLTWLGGSALWHARRHRACDDSAEREPAQPVGRLAAFRSGLGTNLLNPKAGVFYMSLLPQFIPHGAPVFGSTLLLTLVDVVELSVLYGIVSGAASALAKRLAKASFRRRMEQVSGVVFLGFAASLVWDKT
jgi:threonine/homoserine/homoserine lactone efflux protein